jgi:pilus assembly protein Flp/PilA
MGELPATGIGAMARFAKLIRDQKGATAVEYGLIIALIVIAMIAGLTQFAGTTIGMWNNVSTAVSGTTPS